MPARLAIVLAFVAAIATSCSRERVPAHPQPPLLGEPLNVEVFSNGRLAKATTLPGGSAIADVLESVLASKDGSWQTTSISFAPDLLVRGDTFGINFQKDRVILNTKDARGQSVQLVSGLTATEYARIREAIESALGEGGNN